MYTTNIFRPILALALLLATAVTVSANVGGITGVYAQGCGTCHGGQAAATTVTLEGPRSLRVGQSQAYTFVVANMNAANQQAGCNISFRQGGGAAAGVLTAGVGSRVEIGELTHAGGPLAMNANTARFAFTWLAPATHGVYQFSGAGNAVNNDMASSNLDNWNLSGNINITVIGATFTAPAVGTTICRGTPLTLTWTQTGLSTVRFEWSRDNFANTEVIGNTVDATALSLTYNVPAGQIPGNYVVRIVDIVTSAEYARTNIIAIAGSPVITLQPTTTLVCEGKPLNLSVSASGTSLQYRWRKNGTDIPGGINPLLTINTAGVADAGIYDCVIFGCGGSSTSEAATVTIGLKPRILQQPSAKTVCEGDSVSFSIEASGTDLILQWLKNSEPIPGSNQRKISFARTTLFDEGDYSCRIQGVCSPEATSAVAKLSVIEMPLIRSEPSDRNLKTGDSLTLTFAASGELVTYQWYKDGSLIVGATQRIFRKSNVLRSDSGQYACRVQNQCDTVITRSAIVKVTTKFGLGQLELTSTALTLSDVASCSTVDTLMTGLLVNEGGAPITITSISAEPIANIAIEGVTAPFTLAPNERRDVRIKITPKQSKPFTATATFFATSGNRTFSVSGTAVTGLAFQTDTLGFTQGVTGDRKCNLSIPLPCPTTTVTRIRVTGLGASTWGTVSLGVPLSISNGNTIELCFETSAESGEDALVTVETDAGNATFVLTRRVLSGVDEDEAPVTRVRIAPNPMTDELRITTPFIGELRIRIVTVTGVTVALLSGTSEIIWNRRGISGSVVASGLYVLIIEQGGTTRYEKILLR